MIETSDWTKTYAEWEAKAMALAKRDLVLDLLECRKFLAAGDKDNLKVMVAYCQLRALQLKAAGVNWRLHRVRSKQYKGYLGALFNEFIPYQSKTMKAV